MGYPSSFRGYISGVATLSVNDLVLNQQNAVVQGFPINDSIATAAPTSQTAWAVYLGQTSARIASGTTLRLFYQVNGAFSGITWAEAAIATGAYAGRTTNPTLTVVATGDISSDITGTGAGQKILSATTADIAAGTGLWGILAANATGLGTYRGHDGGNFHGFSGTRASTQPSTVVGTAQAYTVRNAGTAEPLMFWSMA